MAQVQVITGVERRRRWSGEQKRAIVAAAFAPGAVVSEIARRADINTGLIYRWRQELRAPSEGFAEVVMLPGAGDVPAVAAAPALEVEFADHTRVRIPASTSPELAAAVVAALARR
jgi:transposase